MIETFAWTGFQKHGKHDMICLNLIPKHLPLVLHYSNYLGYGSEIKVPKGTRIWDCLSNSNYQFWVPAILSHSQLCSNYYCCMTLIIQWTKFQQHFKKFDLGNVRYY